MIRCKDYIPRVVYVGADPQLSDELRAMVREQKKWDLETFQDPHVASTLRNLKDASVVVLYVANESSYGTALSALRVVARHEIPTVVIYDVLTPQHLLELYKHGAVECIGRPVNLTRLSLVLDMLTATHRAKQVKPSAGVATESSDWYDDMMMQVESVAKLSTTVLITGETGCGKTRLSRLIHGLSPRKDKPFLALNCGALSESLLDTELFGHAKGSFTGADQDYVGKLAQCRDGTLLLDEIDMLSPAAQVKLLQVVEDRVFQPVGSSKFEPMEARLIVASNRPLQDEVDKGRFRSDLFYRLNVMSFRLPPLRERPHEIVELARGFIEEFATQHNFEISELAPQALSTLESYAWPGNIRELRNVMERAVILASGSAIEIHHLPSQILDIQQAQPQKSPPIPEKSKPAKNELAQARNDAERAKLLDALNRNDNNRSKTALDLGISRVALYKRLRKLHIL